MDRPCKGRRNFQQKIICDQILAFQHMLIYPLVRMKLIIMRHGDHFENALTKYGIGQTTDLGQALPQIIATHGIDVSRVLFLVSPQGRTRATAHRLEVHLESCGTQHCQYEVVEAFENENDAGYQKAAELIAERCKREDYTLVWVVTHFFHTANVPYLILSLMCGDGAADPVQTSTAYCDPILIDTATGKSWYPL